MHNGDIQWTLAVIVLAAGLAVGLMVVLRHFWQADENEAQVRLGGAYSPILTWLKYRRLPRWQHRPPMVIRKSAAPRISAVGARLDVLSNSILTIDPTAAGSLADGLRATAIPSPTVTNRRPVDILGFGLGVVLLVAAVGQMLVLATPDQPTWGLLFYASAVAGLIGLTIKVGQPAARRSFVARQLPRQAPVFGLWFTCLVLWLYALRQVNRDLPVLDRYLLDAAWLASILFYTVSVLRAARWRWLGLMAVRQWLLAHRRELALIGFLLVAAFVVRAYDLTYHPYSFVNDEGEVGKEALAILNGARSNFFEAGWSGQPVWSFVPTAISVALLGHTAVAGRLVSVVEGTLAVFFVYMLAREAFGRKTAFLAGAVLLGLAWHIHFSRLGVSNVIDSFFASGVLWLTYRALRRGRPIDYLLAGLAAGLTLYTYLGSRLVLAMAVGMLAYVLVWQRDYFRTHYQHLSVYVGALLVVAGPNVAYFANHPNEFMGRLNSEGILQNGWLQRQSVTLGRTYFSLLLEQFSHSTLVFIGQNAPGSFFNSPRPYLTALAAIFFVLGLAVSMWRITQPRYLLVCGWFWSVVVFGSTLTLGPPSSQRLIMTAPVAALLVAIGIREVARLASALRLLTPQMGWIAAVGLVGIISAQGIAFYFGDYRLGHYYEDPSNDFSYEVSTYIETLGPSYHVFLLGDPSIYSGFADFGYLAPDVQVTDFNTVTPDTLAALPRDKGAFFVAIPRRVDDLHLVQQWLPGGTWQAAPRRFQAPQMDYFAYQVPASVLVSP